MMCFSCSYGPDQPVHLYSQMSAFTVYIQNHWIQQNDINTEHMLWCTLAAYVKTTFSYTVNLQKTHMLKCSLLPDAVYSSFSLRV